jgi:shikimate dehydrogenase
MITGNTDVYGVIGNPARHSLSPMIHNMIAAARGDDLAYLAFTVEDIAAAVQGGRALGVKGFNVTMPHKASALKLSADADETALNAQAANTLALTPAGYKAYNTDIYGVYAALTKNGAAPKGKRVVIIGAGGAAAAAALAVCEEAGSVVIANRTPEKARELAGRISGVSGASVSAVSIEALTGLPGCDILINATSAGFGAQAGISPVKNPDWLGCAGFFLDAVYSPWETAAVKEAAKRGVKAVNGFDMLFYQAVKAYEIWRGKLEPDFTDNARAQAERAYLEGVCRND